jgi:hypothetical protein
VIHTSPWIYFSGMPPKPLPESWGLAPHTHYLTMERAFWSAILGGLTLALGGEGLVRLWRQKGSD